MRNDAAGIALEPQVDVEVVLAKAVDDLLEIDGARRVVHRIEAAASRQRSFRTGHAHRGQPRRCDAVAHGNAGLKGDTPSLDLPLEVPRRLAMRKTQRVEETVGAEAGNLGCCNRSAIGAEREFRIGHRAAGHEAQTEGPQKTDLHVDGECDRRRQIAAADAAAAGLGRRDRCGHDATTNRKADGFVDPILVFVLPGLAGPAIDQAGKFGRRTLSAER
ncbi:hypothetical protein GXN78_38900 (plasmid) [Variovorax sp. WS11]|nr:hypothetical protein [Variovorax sp. WS11]